jgi:hypothetical protein
MTHLPRPLVKTAHWIAFGAVAFLLPSVAQAAEPQLQSATVITTVDIYDRPGGGGKVIGALGEGAPDVIATCRADGWCHVYQWLAPAVLHHWGWVYSGPDYKSLQF